MSSVKGAVSTCIITDTTLPNVVFAGYHARSRRPMVEDVQIKGGEIHKVVDYSE